MPGKKDQNQETAGEKPSTPANSDQVADTTDDAPNDQDKYEPPSTNREITQTDRLNKQLLESLLNRMQAAAQATVPDDDESRDDSASPRNSIDWQ